MTAGGHAGKQAALSRKTEKLPKAKAGIEMVAGAGGNFRFRREWSGDDRAAVRAGGHRVRSRMNDDRIDFHPGANFFAQSQQVIRRFSARFDAESFGDVVAFLLVKAENDVEVFLKCGYEFKCAQNVLTCALLRIGQIEKQFAPHALHTGTDVFED